MPRKNRVWEVISAGSLPLVLVPLGAGFLYVRCLNHALTAALLRRDAPAAFILLRMGATDVNAPALRGSDHQAVFLAARSGSPEFLRLVLDRGGDANARRSDGHTPLMAASMRPGVYQDILIGLLVDRGGDVNATDAEGITAVHYAVGSDNNLECVRTLARFGANVDSQDRTGRTPLMQASRAGDVDAVSVLLRCGADPGLRNQAGNTALALARKPHPGRGPRADTGGVARLLRRAGHAAAGAP